MVTEEGWRVTGRDPLVTFLAGISRSPDVEGIGRRTGLYRLRGACVDRLRVAAGADHAP